MHHVKIMRFNSISQWSVPEYATLSIFASANVDDTLLMQITDVESADDIILPMEPCTVDFGDGTTSVLELRSPMGNSALDWDAMRSSYVGVIHW